MWLSILSGVAFIAAGAVDYLAEWDEAWILTLAGLIVAALCLIFQAAISIAKEKTVGQLQDEMHSATAVGMGKAFAELSQDLKAITRIHQRGWTPERSEEFQTRVVEMACRALKDSGIKMPRVSFYVAAAVEIQPGEDQDQANIQVLHAFHSAHGPGRRDPSQAHQRESDEHKMFGLLKDPRPSHVKSRKNLPPDYEGRRSALRVGVVGNLWMEPKKQVPWGVLTADSTETYAFEDTSEAILGAIADLLILARTAESSAPDVSRLHVNGSGVPDGPNLSDLVESEGRKGQ